MISVHLYGKLRRFSDNTDPTLPSIAAVPWQSGDTVGQIIAKLGIPVSEVGSNVFLNGRYANGETSIQDGDRLGLFPDDMQLLYKWYFAPQGTAAAPSNNASEAPNQDSSSPVSSNEDEK